MSIEIGEKGRLFTLQTKDAGYQMLADEKNVLLHLYYGSRIDSGENMQDLIYRTDMGFSGNPPEAGGDRTYSLDYLPQEVSGFGTGDYRDSMIHLTHGDDSQAADFRFKGYELHKGSYQVEGMPALYDNEAQTADTLIITLEERASALELELYYSVFEQENVITRSARLVNCGGQRVYMERFLSMQLDMSFGAYDMIYFAGRHAYEREMERVPVQRAKVEIGSIRGTSSHHYNPAFLLCEKGADEDHGECYGFCLAYSGNFLASAQTEQRNQTRVLMGIHPNGFHYALEPGDSFMTPQVIMSYSGEGFGTLSRQYHRILREHMCRGRFQKERRPVLINNWEATYLDFNQEKIVNLAQQAAKLGVEMLVLDDGWFGKREQDNSGLGDWFVNEKKLGGTMKQLGESVNALGMKFGLWFEPEMISEDSDLYRKHPDWALRIPGREPNRARCQLVLDMSREEVRDYLFERLCDILENAPIAYVKWDMNRSICDMYSHSGIPSGELYHRYVLGLYDLLERFVNRFPDILLEGCSGGGGRFDAGMLYYSPQIWCSDNTDAINRLSIQYGTSFFYPISSMGAHVSACPNHQTGRSTPFETRGNVALSGSFGYELDLNTVAEEEKALVPAQIERFHHFYELTHEGDYYRLTAPGQKQYMAWEFVDEKKERAMVTLVQTDAQGNPIPLHFRLKGLNPTARYRCLMNNAVHSGGAWMKAGFTLPAILKEYESLILEFERID